ncbi:LysR family transcriptional regulator [Novosphingobium sp.]|uniref:LysR family transcriptional regulator n=1 Tax=Novosphingobium sp. TaxID=1874826 RepID=UPI003B5272EF
MRFKGLDLNLIVALDVLLELRSVSRAADRLHMSQPAMSAALGRLRDYFHDPILTAHGKRMAPTAHALSLRPMITALLADVDAMVSASTLFDPAIANRRFRIGTSDYLAAVLFARLIPLLQHIAPQVTVELVPPSDRLSIELSQGDLDLVITPAEYTSPDHPCEFLFDERHVVVGCAANPVFARTMTERDFFDAGHVVAEMGNARPGSFGENRLRELGRVGRRIEVRVFSFLLVPEMLVGTTRLALMHERLARVFAGRIAIAHVAPPFDFPIMREMLQYHRAREQDAGLRWLMDQCKNIVEIDKPDPER